MRRLRSSRNGLRRAALPDKRKSGVTCASATAGVRAAVAEQAVSSGDGPIMKLSTLLSTALFLAAVASPALADGGPADTARGLELARKLCSNCHLVGPGEAEPVRPYAPPFTAIASHAGQTPERARGGHHRAAPGMPGPADNQGNPRHRRLHHVVEAMIAIWLGKPGAAHANYKK